MDKWKKGGMPFQVSVREPVVEVSVCVGELEKEHHHWMRLVLCFGAALERVMN